MVYGLKEYTDFNDSPENYINCGVLALPIQMRECGFQEKEIKLVQDIFQKYNDMNKWRDEEKDARRVYEMEDKKADLEERC